jgi:hypothetical protein
VLLRAEGDQLHRPACLPLNALNETPRIIVQAAIETMICMSKSILWPARQLLINWFNIFPFCPVLRRKPKLMAAFFVACADKNRINAGHLIHLGYCKSVHIPYCCCIPDENKVRPAAVPRPA